MLSQHVEVAFPFVGIMVIDKNNALQFSRNIEAALL